MSWRRAGMAVLAGACVGIAAACGSGEEPTPPDGDNGGGGTPPTVAQVTVAPESLEVAVGATAWLTATTLDARGQVLAGRAVTWTSSDTLRVRVGADGAVTALDTGTAVVTAASEGRSATARVRGVALAVPPAPPPPLPPDTASPPPPPPPPPPTSGPYADVLGVTYCTGPKSTGGTVGLKLDVLYPKAATTGPLPVALWVHGGAWQGDNVNSPLYPQIRDELLARGFAVVPIHYRLSNTTNGLGPAPWPAPLEDAKCAVRWLRAHADLLHLDAERIGAWGQSAGGHIVAALGTVPEGTDEGAGGWADRSSRVRAVAVLAPITDLTRGSEVAGIQASALRNEFPAWPDTTAASIRDASPMSWVSSDDAPFLLVHGDADAMVGVEQSERLDALLRAAGVPSTLVVVAGGDHSFTTGTPAPAETVAAVVAFFEARVR